MSSVKHSKTLILDLPPSCIVFWPQHPQYAVIGTYNLDKTSGEEKGEDEESSEEPVSEDDQSQIGKKSQKRDGSLILVQVDGDDVRIIHTLATPSAILDLHFYPLYEAPSLYNDPSAFAVATSTGSIDIYRVEKTKPTLQLRHEKSFQISDPSIVITSFVFHPKEPVVLASLTTGDIRALNVTSWENRTEILVSTHSLEAWTVAFNTSGTSLYSGGDDSVLMREEFPRLENFVDLEQWVHLGWVDKKIHGAGVTAILPLETELGVDLVLTGSYDDHIRLVNGPLIGRRSILAELNLGGGVWRLKQIDMTNAPSKHEEGDMVVATILASCMHAGARIIRLVRKEEEWSFEVVAKFEEHKSMNYGSDVQPFTNEQGQRTFISTSFYDRLLCLWRF
ncbi:hypothetical protein P154DRAFT_56212 [Amniculicola lignicola CBS 123094]|uniref:PLD phosphodiesterase domain-containing protein n=1 Tax=Amniculicola lignicola CBS 123094 TaxID=1392246 RepID=A0A6A5X1Q3_9PLEO|nr:hypothetical protein P154DRAFT_56212 [Amniculicola lignicola CBS 123094]